MPELSTNVTQTTAVEEPLISPWKEGWRNFKKNKVALFGLGLVIFFILIAIFANVLAPYGINEQKLGDKHLPPSSKHWFGTDDFG